MFIPTVPVFACTFPQEGREGWRGQLRAPIPGPLASSEVIDSYHPHLPVTQTLWSKWMRKMRRAEVCLLTVFSSLLYSQRPLWETSQLDFLNLFLFSLFFSTQLLEWSFETCQITSLLGSNGPLFLSRTKVFTMISVQPYDLIFHSHSDLISNWYTPSLHSSLLTVSQVSQA